VAPLHAELIAGAYPANRDSTIVLRDGSTLAVRPIKPEDEAGQRISWRKRSLAFFSEAQQRPPFGPIWSRERVLGWP